MSIFETVSSKKFVFGVRSVLRLLNFYNKLSLRKKIKKATHRAALFLTKINLPITLYLFQAQLARERASSILPTPA